MNREYQLVLHNDIRQIPELATFVEHIANEANMDVSTALSVNLALEEAVTNVMLYAYPKNTKGQVDIKASILPEKIRFVITDSGIPFDPTEKEDVNVDLSLEDRPIGGLGIFLVRNIMDQIAYCRKDGKNILSMIKTI